MDIIILLQRVDSKQFHIFSAIKHCIVTLQLQQFGWVSLEFVFLPYMLMAHSPYDSNLDILHQR